MSLLTIYNSSSCRVFDMIFGLLFPWLEAAWLLDASWNSLNTELPKQSIVSRCCILFLR